MIQANTKKDILLTNVEDTTKMSLSLDSSNQAHIVKVLTENYKYPIASTVREAASNAWDSHIMSNKIDTPFHVRLFKNKTEGYTLEIEDFGLGLDKEGFYQYYMKIGNSSKRGIAGVLGFYGCGAKSALSIENLTNYEVICRKDGIENKFLIFKGEDFPESIVLEENTTTEQNGVLIRVNIERKQYSETVNAIKEQLCYFKTAYIQIENDGFDYLNAKIFENELFSWSEIYPSKEMHINFGGVHYPIDWDILKINKLFIPIGIKIAPDKGINPFFNRESLEYNSFSKKVILEQIQKVSEWFINKYNKEKLTFKNIREIYNYYQNSNKYLEIENTNFKINELEKHSSVKFLTPKYKDLNNIDLSLVNYKWSYFLNNYAIVSKIDYGRHTSKIISKNVINQINTPIYLIKENPKKITIDYLKDQHSYCYFVKKIEERYLNPKSYRDDKSLISILNLKTKPKDKWRGIISDWLILEQELIEFLKPIPEVPKSWIEAQKKAKKISVRNQKLEGEINFKIAEDLEKYSQDWDCKFVSKIINLKDFHKRKSLLVYDVIENRKKLDNLYVLNKKNRYKSNLSIAVVGERDYKKLKELKIHNLTSMEDFIKEKYKIIAKFVTAYKIHKLINENSGVFKSVDFIKKNISNNFGNLLEDLKNYSENYKSTNNDLLEELVKFCDDTKFYDYPIYQNYIEVEKEISKIAFIDLFLHSYSRYSPPSIKDEAIPIIKELLIARKFRMDYTYYNKPVMPKAELVVEELVEN